MYKKFALLAITSLLLSLPMLAQCPTPSASGTLKICFPSNGSKIIGATTFEMSANLAGAGIAGVAVYDNGVKVDSFSYLPERLVEGAIHDGYHKVTVKIWDTEGHIVSANTTFTKVGGLDPWACKPSGTGVTLCSPAEGGMQPAFSVPISFAVATSPKTTAWKLYLDGVAVRHSDASTLKSLVAPLGMSAGQHKATVVAWDSAGGVYKKTHTFTAFNQCSCDWDGQCTAGIVADAPDGFGPDAAVDAPQTFDFHAETVGNAAPIQNMTLTFDGALILQNQGPGVSKTITTTPGSHTIMVQATDTAGKVYATYGTVNVN